MDEQAEQAPRLEQWKNVVATRIGLNRYDRDGKPTPFLVLGGQTFLMSPAERRLNQQIIINKRHDPFTNGSLLLEQGVDDDPDTAQLLGNRETMTADDLEALIDMRPAEFEAYVVDLDSPVTLRRILDRCLELEAGPARVNAIRERLKVLDPDSPLKGDDVGMTASERAKDPVQLPPVNPEGPSSPRQYASLQDLA